MTTIPKSLSAYMAKIGAKGGKATARSLTPEQRKASSDRANAAKQKKREQSKEQ